MNQQTLIKIYGEGEKEKKTLTVGPLGAAPVLDSDRKKRVQGGKKGKKKWRKEYDDPWEQSVQDDEDQDEEEEREE